MPISSGTYTIFCAGNGTVYAGQSVNIRDRWNNHLSKLKRGKHANRRLQFCANKYGADSLEFSVVQYLHAEALDAAEVALIRDLRDAMPEKLLNFSDIAVRPPRFLKRSPETCEKISLAKMGKPQTIEHRRKAALARVGLKRSEEAKKKTAAKHLGMKRSEEAKKNMRGRKATPKTPEHIAKIKASASARMKRLRAEARITGVYPCRKAAHPCSAVA
jgi:group I intron endonuclease